jgi:hypothetical protein
LEEAGFEPSVPQKTPAVVVISALVAPPSPLRQAERQPSRAWLARMGLIGFGSVWALIAALMLTR